MAVEVIVNGTTNGWVPTIWAQEILQHLRSNITITPRVNRNYDTEVANYGDTVNIPKPIALTAQDAPVTTTTTNVAADSVSVTLNKFKTVEAQVGDVFLAQSRPNVMADITRAAGIALAEAIENDLLGLYASATATVGTAGTDVTAAILRAARKALVDNKVPRLEPKYVILSTKDYDSILSDTNITNALNYGGAEAIRRGEVPTVYGLQLLESQLVPVVAGTPNTTYNLAFARDFAVLVTRPLPAPMDGTPSAVVRDTDTGVSFRMVLKYDNQAKAHKISVDVLYGVAALRPEFGVQVLG